jgi:hypothetical protein
VTDIEIYCRCMDRVRHHVSIADAVFARKIDTGHADLNGELIFLHFRKALEEIAFSSISANREQYAAVRAGFATEWNARRMIGFVEAVNPNFYPVPLQPPTQTAAGPKHFALVEDGFLTKDDFAALYDISAEVLHSPNPYNPAGFTIDFKHPVDIWSSRIKALLSWHYIQLLGVDALWVARVANEGPIQTWAAGALAKNAVTTSS